MYQIGFKGYPTCTIFGEHVLFFWLSINLQCALDRIVVFVWSSKVISSKPKFKWSYGVHGLITCQ